MAAEETRRGRHARTDEAVAEEEVTASPEADDVDDEARGAGRRRGPDRCRRPRCRNEVVYRTDGREAEAVSYCREHLPANVTEGEIEEFGRRA